MGKYSVYIFLLLLFVISEQSHAQSKRSAHWFFGTGAGLNFNSGIPVADTNSTIYTIEGSASISDTAGNLLFYSDGQLVWNRNHVVMPNGSGMFGNITSVQSCLIVPFPGNSQQYYIFTVGPDFAYSIVDMSLDNGLGDVVVASKNTILFSAAGEDVAGTMHCNAADYWIVARQRNSWTYNTYLLDSSGLSAPITYSFNMSSPQVGHLIFSQDGSLLSASVFTNKNYIFDFDRQTGILMLQDSIVMGTAGFDRFYSAAFSPDNSKIYTSYWVNNGYAYISQFDRNAPNLTASRVDLDSIYFHGSTNGYGWIGRMQLASDQHIYISRWGRPFLTCPSNYCIDSLDAILQPDSAGLACDHQQNVVYLDGRPTKIGLPSFVSQFTAPGIPQYSCMPDGVNEIVSESSFTLFPNPFSDRAEIRLDHYEKNSEFEVYNAAGSLVRKQPITAAHFYFEAEGLANGIYFCRIKFANGVLTGKMVIVN